MRLYVDIDSERVSSGHPKFELMSMDAHFKVNNFMNDEILVTSLFGDPYEEGNEQMQYYHLSSSNMLEPPGKLFTCSILSRQSNTLRAMSGFYTNRRVICDPIVDIKTIGNSFFSSEHHNFNFIHIIHEESNSFISGRINCTEHLASGEILIRSVVRIPIFCLATLSPTASLIRENIIKMINYGNANTGNLCSLYQSETESLTAELWIIARVGELYEKAESNPITVRLAHPLINNQRQLGMKGWFNIATYLFGSNSPCKLSFS